jgi:predicted O-methyltransferase YrrM
MTRQGTVRGGRCIGSHPTRSGRHPHEEATIETPLTAARAFAEAYPPVDPVVLHAMSWANELGVGAVGPAAGAALRLLAAASRAKSVVEIGTGTGVSGLWLLAGMRPDGILTSIDLEPDHQAMARQSFAAAGHAQSRARLIPGAALEVLPRLADGAYDLVFVDTEITEYAPCVSAAHRLLRDGGVLVVNNALGVAGSVADPDATDLATLTMRELVAYIRDVPEWSPTLLPAGAGLLCATKTPADRQDLPAGRVRGG